MAFIRKNNKKIQFNLVYLSNIVSFAFQQIYKEDLIKHRDLILDVVNKSYDDIGKKYILDSQIELFLDEIVSIIKNNIPKEKFYLHHAIEEWYESNKEKNKTSIFWKIKKNINDKEYTINVSREDWVDFFEKLSIDYIEKSKNFFYFSILKDELLKIKSNNLVKTEEQWYEFFYEKCFDFLNKEPRIIYFIQALQIRKKLSDILGVSWLEQSSFLNIKNAVKQSSNKIILGFEKREEVFLLNNNELFKVLTKEFIEEIFKDNFYLLKPFDLNKIINEISINNEYKITWLAEHLFVKNNCLFEIQNYRWKSLQNFFKDDFEYLSQSFLKEDFVNKKTYEPLQWLFLRTALRLAFLDKTDPNLTAIKIYKSLSNLEIMLPESIYRELNKIDKHFNELNFHKNFSLKMEDDYDDIQMALFDSITRTKWSGTVNLNFSNIRKKGSIINNGRRISNGITPYVEMLNGLIKTQGREKNDLPISISLPIYHYDLFGLFLENSKPNKEIQFVEQESKLHLANSLFKEEQQIEDEDREIKQQYENLKNFDGLNRNIILSDIFMWRVFNEIENQDWYLMDPNYFKTLNLDLNKEEDYLKAEEEIVKGNVPKVFYIQKKAKKVFFTLLKKVKDNNVNLIFPEFFLQQNNFKGKNIIFGKNGQNAIPERRRQFYLNFSINIADMCSLNIKNELIKKDKLYDNLLTLFYICHIFFKKNYCFVNLLGIEDLLKKIINNNNKVLDEIEIERLKNKIIFDFFNVVQILKNNLNNISFFDFKIKNKPEYLEKQHFNDFVLSFIEKRKGIQFVKPLNEKLNKDFYFNHWFIDDLFCLNFDPEQSYIANVEEGHIGLKETQIEVFDKGKRKLIPTSTFLLKYSKNKTDHEIFNKVFMKKSYSYYMKNEILNDFFPNHNKIKKEINFYNKFLPFFRQGASVSISRNIPFNDLKNIIFDCWLNGVTNVLII